MCLNRRSRLESQKDFMRKAVKDCLCRKPGRKSVLGTLGCGKVISYSDLQGTQMKNMGCSGS